MSDSKESGRERDLDIRNLSDEELEYMLSRVEEGIEQFELCFGAGAAPRTYFSLYFTKTMLEHSLHTDTDDDPEVRTDGGTDASGRERFKYVLECPRYGCDTWVATASEITSLNLPPTCYCPNHDDFVEMHAEPVKSGNKDTGS